jgi:hypothetical protein
MVDVAIDEKQSGLAQLASCGSAAQHCVGADETEIIGQSYLPLHNFTDRFYVLVWCWSCPVDLE